MTWMADNLKTTRFNDGTEIRILSNQEWADNYSYSLKIPSYSFEDDEYIDAETYKEHFGALYNWWAVNTDKLCPVGWHVSTDHDWFELALFADPDANLDSINSYPPVSLIAGGKLKETGNIENYTGHWAAGNYINTDDFCFRALPGNFRWFDGGNSIYSIYGDYLFHQGDYWSRSGGNTILRNGTWGIEGKFWHMSYYDSSLVHNWCDPYQGYSVRCVKN
jgi:uncharacterized protein (TIGR02145 family)